MPSTNEEKRRVVLNQIYADLTQLEKELDEVSYRLGYHTLASIASKLDTCVRLTHPLYQPGPRASGRVARDEMVSFMHAYYRQHGITPTIREIASAMGGRSTSTVHKHLKALEDDGRIRVISGRGYVLVPQAGDEDAEGK